MTLMAKAGRLEAAGVAYALAAVVQVNGSAYRRPGARMLISADGETTGTISGGCLEGEVALRAVQMLEAKALPFVHPFQLTADDFVGFGVGCDGVVHVLIEPVPQPDQHSPIGLLRAAHASRATSVLVTCIEAKGAWANTLSRRYLASAAGAVQHDSMPEEVLYAAVGAAQLAQQQGKPHVVQHEASEGSVALLAEVLRPPVRLVIFGDGHDVAPVVQFGKALGWTVEVVGRKNEATLRTRFPEADRWHFLMHPERAAEQVPVDAYTTIVSMNHNYSRDRSVLHALLSSEAPYVGMLGPKRRTERMLADLAEEGYRPTPEHRACLRGPVGLDIGTETSEEIALALVAEVQAVLQGRSGSALSERDGPIHAPLQQHALEKPTTRP